MTAMQRGRSPSAARESRRRDVAKLVTVTTPKYTLQRVAGQLRFVPPKTDDSERTVPLPPICEEALRGHLRRQQDERDEAGEDWHDHGLVFPPRVGTPMEPDNLRRSWDRIKARAGLDGVLHDARHTCVSLLLDLGVPPHVDCQLRLNLDPSVPGEL